VAEDQVPVGAALGDAGAAAWLGPYEATSATEVGDAVVELARDESLGAARSAAARRLVDGRGPSRVVAEMRAPLLDLRPARAEDAALVWEWANDPVTRDSSFATAPIPWEDHVDWFTARLADPSRPLYLADGPDGTPVGQVRFDPFQEEAEIGVTVAPSARGLGVAAPLILAGARRTAATYATSTVHAHVRPENAASLAAFAAAGFEATGAAPAEVPAAVQLRWEARDAA
jgi:RimJ/RimL family protein N-acetyltransferase